MGMRGMAYGNGCPNQEVQRMIYPPNEIVVPIPCHNFANPNINIWI